MLRWFSPLGWIEEIHPLTGSRSWLLAVIAVIVVVLCGIAAWLAGGRDVGASPLPSRDQRAPRLALLRDPLGLTVRLTLPVLVGWVVGLGVFGAVLGLVAKSAAEAVSGSTVIEDVIGRLGVGHWSECLPRPDLRDRRRAHRRGGRRPRRVDA